MKPPNPPPLSENEAPVRVCSRALTWPQKQGDPACGKPAFLHVAWIIDDDGIDAGFVCEEHAAELDERGWIPVQAHELGDDCGMPGAVWNLTENRCCYEEEGSGAEAPVMAIAREVLV